MRGYVLDILPTDASAYVVSTTPRARGRGMDGMCVLFDMPPIGQCQKLQIIMMEVVLFMYVGRAEIGIACHACRIFCEIRKGSICRDFLP